jgi:twitching motility protein PilT
MGTSIRIKDVILNGESEGKTFYEMQEKARPFGWSTFDDSIMDLYQDGQISEDTALAYASKRPVVKRGIDQLKSAKGEKTTDIEGLRIDSQYSRRQQSEQPKEFGLGINLEMEERNSRRNK